MTGIFICDKCNSIVWSISGLAHHFVQVVFYWHDFNELRFKKVKVWKSMRNTNCGHILVIILVIIQVIKFLSKLDQTEYHNLLQTVEFTKLSQLGCTTNVILCCSHKTF